MHIYDIFPVTCVERFCAFRTCGLNFSVDMELGGFFKSFHFEFVILKSKIALQYIFTNVFLNNMPIYCKSIDNSHKPKV